MSPLDIIRKYYDPDSKAYYFLIHHSRLVAKKAVEIAKRVGYLNPDLAFIEEAAMLHDIGIFFTNAPKIGCYGYKDYICHGYLGRELLEKEGLPRHALVCERHVGLGVTIDDIKRYKLPLPVRDMVPITTEEKIVCLADKFFSKSEHDLLHEKHVERVREIIAGYGPDKLAIFDEWLEMFGINK
ncbi:MAG: HD domain-containing protein [Thermodesulfovibrionales bacterium]